MPDERLAQKPEFLHPLYFCPLRIAVDCREFAFDPAYRAIVELTRARFLQNAAPLHFFCEAEKYAIR